MSRPARGLERQTATTEDLIRETSGIPGRRADRSQHLHRPDPGTKTAGPGEHTRRTCHASGEAWPSQGAWPRWWREQTCVRELRRPGLFSDKAVPGPASWGVPRVPGGCTEKTRGPRGATGQAAGWPAGAAGLSGQRGLGRARDRRARRPGATDWWRGLGSGHRTPSPAVTRSRG
ncbi:hypothetical protein NDU88_001485 [Pleurodeles waltl]|uniref:Uncharacterized protein n=1 Tax=Pleurodeles waltl TaxID=8319 RepID=A0AAV7THY9_PLEWA|nr:hypothetical protein NDU88_001485 [Pleurodeles waltl]